MLEAKPAELGAAMLVPQPLYSDQDVITLPLDEYFELHPEIRDYVVNVKTETDPVAVYDSIRMFLARYIRHDQATGTSSTFVYYRGVTERLLLWCWIVHEQPLSSLKTKDLEDFFKFCVSPPNRWIGASPFRRFIATDDGKRVPNLRWRPFSSASNTEASGPRALAGIRSVCTRLFYYLESKRMVQANPAVHIENSFIESIGGKGISLVGRLEKTHLEYLLKAAKGLCAHNPEYERSLFIMAMIVYLLVPGRFISGSKTWQPLVSSFHKNARWSYLVIDSGNCFKLMAPADFDPYLERYLEARRIMLKHGEFRDGALFTTLTGRPGLTIRQVSNLVKEISCEAARLMSLDGCSKSAVEQVSSARLDSIRTAGIMNSIDLYGFDQTRARLCYESINALYNRFAADSNRPLFKDFEQ